MKQDDLGIAEMMNKIMTSFRTAVAALSVAALSVAVLTVSTIAAGELIMDSAICKPTRDAS